MTKYQHPDHDLLQSLNQLREKGYAVVVFSPSELEGVEDYISSLEDGLVSDGNDRIDLYRELAGVREEGER